MAGARATAATTTPAEQHPRDGLFRAKFAGEPVDCHGTSHGIFYKTAGNPKVKFLLGFVASSILNLKFDI